MGSQTTINIKKDTATRIQPLADEQRRSKAQLGDFLINKAIDYIQENGWSAFLMEGKKKK